jgi:DNA-binding MarR family transcriptional regulator
VRSGSSCRAVCRRLLSAAMRTRSDDRRATAALLTPSSRRYMDDALKPVSMQDAEVLALFTHSETARKAVQHTRKAAELTKTRS